VSDGSKGRTTVDVVCDMCLPGSSSLDAREKVLSRWVAAGFHFVSVTVAADRWHLEQTVTAVAGERARYLRASDSVVLADSVAAIRRAKAEGKLAIGFNVQGTNGLNGNVHMVEAYRRLGVGQMLLAYNQKNMVGDGCHERTDAGLSRFGISVVREMNRVGMIVDCSHTGYRTTMDAMEASAAPVIFSHSNARSVRDHPRNIVDEQIRRCAQGGGVVGINGVGPYLGENDASPAAFFAHVDHVVQMVGPAHVGLGLDFVFYEEEFYARVRANPSRYPPEDYPIPLRYFGPESLSPLVDLMARHGYGDAAIADILGGNFMRVAEKVWGS